MRRGLLHLGLLAAAFAGGAVSSGSARSAADGDEVYRSLGVFARVLSYVESHHVTQVDSKALIYGAIRGMLATLDAHSTFMDPEQFAAAKSEAQGEFGGIGVELVRRDAEIVVVELYEGSPAQRAGLLPGDAIVRVGGEEVRGQSLAEVSRRIKGAPGTPVRLGLLRGKKLEELTVVRERIRVVSVDGRRLEGQLAYLRIRAFSERTAQDLARAVAQLEEGGPIRGLVLDLRDNPGGLLEEAVRVADTWLAGGVIVSTEGRNRPAEVEVAHPKGTQPDYPLVVLVNGGTASAAEIVAGALQDHRRAVLLGTQTFGKGSVQTVIELEDRSALKLTVARYFTPSHRSIQGTGITPDMVVPPLPSGEPVAPAEATVEPAALGDPSVASLGAPVSDHQLEAALRVLARWSKGDGTADRGRRSVR